MSGLKVAVAAAPASVSSSTAAARQPSGGTALIAAKSLNEPASTSATMQQIAAVEADRNDAIPPSSNSPIASVKPFAADKITIAAAKGSGASVMHGARSKKLAANGSSASLIAMPANPIGNAACGNPPVASSSSAAATTTTQVPILIAAGLMDRDLITR